MDLSFGGFDRTWRSLVARAIALAAVIVRLPVAIETGLRNSPDPVVAPPTSPAECLLLSRNSGFRFGWWSWLPL